MIVFIFSLIIASYSISGLTNFLIEGFLKDCFEESEIRRYYQRENKFMSLFRVTFENPKGFFTSIVALAFFASIVMGYFAILYGSIILVFEVLGNDGSIEFKDQPEYLFLSLFFSYVLVFLIHFIYNYKVRYSKIKKEISDKHIKNDNYV